MIDWTQLKSLAMIAALPAVLTACEVAPNQEGAQTADDTPAGFTEPGEDGGSIMRPEIEQEKDIEDSEALEPLRVTLGFPEGGDDVGEAASTKLTVFLTSEQVVAGGPITVTGHSDSAGSDASNLAASQKRADAVAARLIEGGVAEERITVIALGEQNPILPNAKPDGSPNEVGRAANRRVDLHVLPPKNDTEPQEHS